MGISVCIISNVINDTLRNTMLSYQNVAEELLVGINEVTSEAILNFQQEMYWARIIPISWTGYGGSKNTLSQLAKNDWILSVDSDESASEELQNSIKSLQLTNENTAYAILRINLIGEKRVYHGDLAPEYKIRLYNKNKISWNDDKVHEQLVLPEGTIVQQLQGALWHHTSPSIAKMQEKNNHYAILSAQNYFEKGKNASFGKRYFAPIVSFLKHYLIKKGFLDGSLGFALAKEYARYTALKYRLLQDLQKEKAKHQTA